MRLRILAAAAIGIVGAGLFTAPAQAAGETWCGQTYNSDDYLTASGCFLTYGDHVLVTDFRADGLRAVVQWVTDYGRSGQCADADGANNGTVDCNYDLSETGYLSFRVVTRNGAEGAVVDSTPWSEWIYIGA